MAATPTRGISSAGPGCSREVGKFLPGGILLSLGGCREMARAAAAAAEGSDDSPTQLVAGAVVEFLGSRLRSRIAAPAMVAMKWKWQTLAATTRTWKSSWA